MADIMCSQGTPYDLAHAAALAKRIALTSDIEALEELRGELMAMTSALFTPLTGPWTFESLSGAQTDLYWLYLCLQSRLGTKLTRKRHAFDTARTSESAMYAAFVTNPQRYIPGAVLVPGLVRGDKRPDFFLTINGTLHIAEFKARPFRSRDVYQLEDYLQSYNVAHGFAVAPSLRCTLPQHMTFIQMEAP